MALTQMWPASGVCHSERIYKWAKRVGLEEIRRQTIGDADKRKAYYDRLSFADIRPGRSPVGSVSGKRCYEFADGDDHFLRQRSEEMDMNWISIGDISGTSAARRPLREDPAG